MEVTPAILELVGDAIETLAEVHNIHGLAFVKVQGSGRWYVINTVTMQILKSRPFNNLEAAVSFAKTHLCDAINFQQKRGF